MFKGLRDKARCDARGEASREPPRPARCRDALVVVLTLTTGALDAVSYLRLGKVFSSVITGNLALLGVAAGQHDAMLALNAGLALAGYACGVLVGGTFAGTPERGQPAWPVRVTFTLVVEWGVLAAFSGEWLVTGGHPADASRLAMLLLGAAAMGMQSTAVRRLGPDVHHLPDQHPDRRSHGSGDPPVACQMATQHRGYPRRRDRRNPGWPGRSVVSRLGPRCHSRPDNRCSGRFSQSGPAPLTGHLAVFDYRQARTASCPGASDTPPGVRPTGRTHQVGQLAHPPPSLAPGPLINGAQ